MTRDNVYTELDDYARELLDQYRASREAIDSWEELRRKAADQLMDWLASREATAGTVEGEPAVSLVEYDRRNFDTTKFRADEPALYNAYLKDPLHIRQLRLP